MIKLTSICNEVWLDIKDYEGYYQVSNLGRIRSLDRVSIVKIIQDL